MLTLLDAGSLEREVVQGREALEDIASQRISCLRTPTARAMPGRHKVSGGGPLSCGGDRKAGAHQPPKRPLPHWTVGARRLEDSRLRHQPACQAAPAKLVASAPEGMKAPLPPPAGCRGSRPVITSEWRLPLRKQEKGPSPADGTTRSAPAVRGTTRRRRCDQHRRG